MKQDRRAAQDLSALVDGVPRRARLLNRLVQAGAESLTDDEVLDMILASAVPLSDSAGTAHRLLKRFGSFSQAITAPLAELSAIEGVGEAGAAALKLVQAAAARLAPAGWLAQGVPAYRPLVHNWERLIEYLTAILARERVEQMRILYLDRRNRLISDDVERLGVIDYCIIDPRLLVKRAYDKQASAIILVHFHPLGAPTPSTAAIALARAIKLAATGLAIVLHDHVIIGGGTWVSMKRFGLL